jgi:hypothetical protein
MSEPSKPSASKPVEPKKWSRVFKGEHVSSGVWVDRDVSLNQTLYRYVQWKPHGEGHLNDGALFFSAPSRWPDPYEKWWCEELFRPGSKLSQVSPYALCMTTSWGDEPYWRMYDHSGTVPVVRFTTTVGRLVAALSNFVVPLRTKVFIGKVQYHSSNDLRREAHKLRARGAEGELARHVAHALMLKRTAFAFESEHRAIILDRSPAQKGRFIQFSPTELYTRVMISPSAKQWEAKIRTALAAHGFTSDQIRRSSLYDIP